MDLIKNSILMTGGADTAYIVNTAVLGAIVIFAVWRGRGLTGEQVVGPL